MMKLVWVIPLFPLLSFVLLLVIGKRLRATSAYIGIGLTFLALIGSLLVLIDRFQSSTYKAVVDWLTIGETQVTMGVE